MTTLPYQHAFHWIRSAYLDAPDQRLTVQCVHDKSRVAPDVCGQVLDDLVRAGFLVRTSDGHYARSTRSEHLPLRDARDECPAGEAET